MKAHGLAHLMMRRDAGEEEQPLDFNAVGRVAGEMGQGIKASAAKRGNLMLIPGTRTERGEDWIRRLSSHFQIHGMACAYTHRGMAYTHTHNKPNIILQ